MQNLSSSKQNISSRIKPRRFPVSFLLVPLLLLLTLVTSRTEAQSSTVTNPPPLNLFPLVTNTPAAFFITNAVVSSVKLPAGIQTNIFNTSWTNSLTNTLVWFPKSIPKTITADGFYPTYEVCFVHKSWRYATINICYTNPSTPTFPKTVFTTVLVTTNFPGPATDQTVSSTGWQVPGSQPVLANTNGVPLFTNFTLTAMQQASPGYLSAIGNWTNDTSLVYVTTNSYYTGQPIAPLIPKIGH